MQSGPLRRFNMKVTRAVEKRRKWTIHGQRETIREAQATCSAILLIFLQEMLGIDRVLLET